MSTAEWSDYQQAIRGLTPATLSDGDVAPKPEPDQVDRLLEASDRLGASLTEDLADERADVRELAALKLQAAAAVDLDRANALAAADDQQGMAATLSSGQWDEIDRILATPTEAGILAVVDLRAEGFQATAADAGTLKDAVDRAIDAIAADAGKAAATTVNGLTGIPGDDVKKAFGDGLDKVFERVGDKVNWLKKKAVALVLKAVKKLLAIFGTSTDGAQKKIDTWLDDLNEEKVKGLLQRLYGVDGLKKRYGDRLETAGAVPDDRDQAARQELDALTAKWHKRAGVIDTIGGIVPLARHWIAGIAPPIGMIAYTVAFATATGYVVFAGGDYLDWKENDGLLDMVEGVGSVVDRAAGVVPTAK